MILVTVGTQGPFDRLVKTVDTWAQTQDNVEVFAQIGPTQYRPVAMQFAEGLDPVQFEALLQRADCIVAHAGMGTILKALELGKPVLIMPRRAALGEQRNEHQLATAERLGRLGFVTVASDENELEQHLQNLHEVTAGERISDIASPELIGCLRQFLWEHLGSPD